MDRSRMEVELAHLLVAQLRGHRVELLERESEGSPLVIRGAGISVGGGRTVRVADVVELVLRHAFEPTMFSAKDKEMQKFLDGVAGVVMATREEQQQMWERWHRGEIAWIKSWVSGSSGPLVTIGELAGRPICLSLLVATINGQRILMADATSQLVDHALVDQWIEAHAPDTARKDGRLNRSDATNFTNVLDRS